MGLILLLALAMLLFGNKEVIAVVIGLFITLVVLGTIGNTFC